ncbi:hypothetical protein BDV95DRAFT_644129 [Massariosphaeria phaeospora]|uniref:Uncharacterized protein n=1 Tax=Massariosphaeria phaeospora TaxID=100035 RepID=A0A7C8MJM0_9PLEO|nr:hypothetical protein BDV95DRAFT_644129 [Massariosphaeria phaeospora]
MIRPLPLPLLTQTLPANLERPTTRVLLLQNAIHIYLFLYNFQSSTHLPAYTMPLVKGRKRKAAELETESAVDRFDALKKQRDEENKLAVQAVQESALARLKAARAKKATASTSSDGISETSKGPTNEAPEADTIAPSREDHLLAMEKRMLANPSLPKEAVAMTMAKLRGENFRPEKPVDLALEEIRAMGVKKAMSKGIFKPWYKNYVKQCESMRLFYNPDLPRPHWYILQEQKARLADMTSSEEFVGLRKSHAALARNPVMPDTIKQWRSDVVRNQFARYYKRKNLANRIPDDFVYDANVKRYMPTAASNKLFQFDGEPQLRDVSPPAKVTKVSGRKAKGMSKDTSQKYLDRCGKEKKKTKGRRSKAKTPSSASADEGEAESERDDRTPTSPASSSSDFTPNKKTRRSKGSKARGSVAASAKPTGVKKAKRPSRKRP